MSHPHPREPHPIIDPTRCRRCGRCMVKAACPSRAVRITRAGAVPSIHAAACDSCMICLSACPAGAVTCPECAPGD